MKQIFAVLFITANLLICQTSNHKISVEDFDNSAKHWYFINDTDKIIYPKLDKNSILLIKLKILQIIYYFFKKKTEVGQKIMICLQC